MGKLAVGGIACVISIVLLQVGCAPSASRPATAVPATSALPGEPTAAVPATSNAMGRIGGSRRPPQARHRQHHHLPAVVDRTPSPQLLAWCSAAAYYDEQTGGYYVSVSSNQRKAPVTATGAEGSATDAAGHAAFYVYANGNAGSITITVRVGAASCTTNA